MKTKLFYAGALALCVIALVACAAPAPTPTAGSNVSAILTATAPTAALKPSDAALEQELVIYSASQVLDFAAKAFQDKTGIKVSTVYLPSGDILRRVDAEKARPLGDVVWEVGSETVGSRPDLFEPYKLKEVDQLFPEAVDKSNLTVPANLSASATIIYNKKLVPAADVPKKWADLLDPKWKGKIVGADPSINSSAYSWLVTRLLAFKDKGWEFEEKLIQNMVIVYATIQIPPKISVGEYALGLGYEEAAYIYARGETATVGVVYPSDGTGILSPVGALIKGAKHPNAAKAFLDFSVSAEFQKAYVNKSYGVRAVRPDVPLPTGLPELRAIKTIEYDQKWAADNRDANLKKYKDLMVKYNK
jgi:iron(III) transport system substrate-binding protein